MGSEKEALPITLFIPLGEDVTTRVDAPPLVFGITDMSGSTGYLWILGTYDQNLLHNDKNWSQPDFSGLIKPITHLFQFTALKSGQATIQWNCIAPGGGIAEQKTSIVTISAD